MSKVEEDDYYSPSSESEQEEEEVGMPKRTPEESPLLKSGKYKQPASKVARTEKWHHQKKGHTFKKDEPIPVSVTGAIAGDTLYGKQPGQTIGIEFVVQSGYVPRRRASVDEFEGGEDALAQALAGQWRMPLEAVRTKLSQIPIVDNSNYMPIGIESASTETATFKLLQPGPLLSAILDKSASRGADAEKIRADVLRLVSENIEFGAGQLLEIFRVPTKKDLLFMHHAWYAVKPSPEPQPCAIVLRTGSCVKDVRRFTDETTTRTYTLEVPGGTPVAIVAPHGAPAVTEKHAIELASLACGQPDDVRLAFEAYFDSASDGQARAALQKTVRFGAKMVGLNALFYTERLWMVSSPAFACAALAKLMASPGSFNPDLGMHTRGCTSAFKRLAVILFEDAWVPDAPIAAFLGAALLAQHVTQWYPDDALMSAAFKACVAACTSRMVLPRHPGGTWPEDTEQGPRTENRQRGVEHCKFREIEPFEHALVSIEELRSCAYLLSAVGSFAGDESMVERFATGATPPVPTTAMPDGVPFPDRMPLEHVVDQHAYAEIGHLMSGKETFARKFARLFDPYAGVTGVNPRRFSGKNFRNFENDIQVAEIRVAQRAVLRLAHGMRPSEYFARLAPTKTIDILAKVPSGTLAGAIGPIEILPGKHVTRKLLVMLGVENPTDAIVMLNPARERKGERKVASETDDRSSYLYTAVDAKEREAAIVYAFSKSYVIHDCPAAPEWQGRTATFDPESERWLIDGVDYDDARARIEQTGTKINIGGAVDFRGLASEPDSLALMALQARTQSDVLGTETVETDIATLCATTSRKALLRAISLCRDQYKAVAFPRPARDGGLASDDLAAYPQDAEAYKFLLLTCVVFPAALVAERAPTFRVRNPRALRWLEERMVSTVHGSFVRIKSKESLWRIEPRDLMTHQEGAVDEMLESSDRGLSGNFLFMSPGMGKTRTTLQFLRRLFAKFDYAPRYIVWTTPKETVDSLSVFFELEKCGALDIAFLETQAATLKRFETAVAEHGKQFESGAAPRYSQSPVPYFVNVVSNNSLRLLVEQLVDVAHETALVVDEADLFYGMTLRTSAAFEIARLCPAVVCQTGTPIRSTQDENLRMWLSLCVDFPVTAKNWLVAASRMVAKNVDLHIDVVDRPLALSLSLTLRSSNYEKYVASRRWSDAARIVYDMLDDLLVETAMREAEYDRRQVEDDRNLAEEKIKMGDDSRLTEQHLKRPQGGVLLEARNREHAEKLRRAINGRRDPEIRATDVANGMDDSYGIIIATSGESRGYNVATRMGALIRTVNPGSAATRRQMLKRVWRLGQLRDAVQLITVYMKGTVLEKLYERQLGVDAYNLTFDALADQFEPDEILKMLTTT